MPSFSTGVKTQGIDALALTASRKSPSVKVMSLPVTRSAATVANGMGSSSKVVFLT